MPSIYHRGKSSETPYILGSWSCRNRLLSSVLCDLKTVRTESVVVKTKQYCCCSFWACKSHEAGMNRAVILHCPLLPVSSCLVLWPGQSVVLSRVMLFLMTQFAPVGHCHNGLVVILNHGILVMEDNVWMVNLFFSYLGSSHCVLQYVKLWTCIINGWRFVQSVTHRFQWAPKQRYRYIERYYCIVLYASAWNSNIYIKKRVPNCIAAKQRPNGHYWLPLDE